MCDGGSWRFWIDRGGTFTDVIAESPEGELQAAKFLSDNPQHYRDAAVAAMQRFLRLPDTAPLPTDRIASVRVGTTLATNALLQRKGADVALLITRGFGDSLLIAGQDRPSLFSLKIQRPEPLYRKVVEVDERVLADGSVLRRLDLAQAREDLTKLRAEGYEAVAIVLMHGYRYTAHERQLAELARELGFPQVSVSHELTALVRLVDRGQTVVADAYLSPVLDEYLQRLKDCFDRPPRAGQLLFMRSDGGLSCPDRFSGCDALLSGPAGGVVGAAAVCRAAGYSRCIAFDMGGTSTDVSLYDGEVERRIRNELDGVRLRVPMIAVHTVAAGGSSILHARDGRLVVGPDSAGANPGPACYRHGGPLCLSDAHVVLGVLVPEYFPQVFGPTADAPLDAHAARTGFATLARTLGYSGGVEEAAEAAVAVAVANMARAIRRITVQRGLDPAEYPLCGFGGACGQHVCAVAETLGIAEVLLHPLSGVLSAWGIANASLRDSREETIEQPLDSELLGCLQLRAQRLSEVIEAELSGIHGVLEQWQYEWSLQLKYSGTDSLLEIPWGSLPDLRQSFERRHESRFGYIDPSGEILVATLSVAVQAVQRPPSWRLEAFSESRAELGERTAKTAAGTTTGIFIDGSWRTAKLCRREQLQVGETVTGPALILERLGTILLRPGWNALMTEDGLLRLCRSAVQPTVLRSQLPEQRADPGLLEIFNHRLMGIAEQMGAVLENSARSVNIRERLDFSCAIFDAEGRLIANAPHIPVHLGSMGEAVKSMCRLHNNDWIPGSAYVTNDPQHGGTHLPDITVVSPVFSDPDRRQPLFFVAARGHHADIGGIAPASMPAGSRNLAEEGVLLHGVPLLADGVLNHRELIRLLESAAYPARNPEQNIADLRAQLAACRRGEQQLCALLREHGEKLVCRYVNFLRDNAAAAVRGLIATLPDGSCSCTMDNGAIVAVSVYADRRNGRVSLDFSASSDAREDNFNAPPAVCRAAVLYVFRSLLRHEIPLNEGCLEPLDIVLRKGSLLSPPAGAPVAAGNVETSQVIVDVLCAALGRLAASQGTMNNLSFGDERNQYYETICGGTGAGPDFSGADAVHSHMTNSRITDPEILEDSQPVQLVHFGLRSGSGGTGRWAGGEGAVRELRFLRAMRVSVLSNRRLTRAFGVDGGGPGRPGCNRLFRRNGEVEILGAVADLRVEPDDRLRIETPGGGAWGTRDDDGV